MDKGDLKTFTTSGGFTAIQVGTLVLRDSLVGERLKEDGETMEEYKLRRKLCKEHVKKKRWLWISKDLTDNLRVLKGLAPSSMGTMTKAKLIEAYKQYLSKISNETTK